MFKQLLGTAAAGFFAAGLAAAQTVTVSLDSPQNGQTVAAGATINWSISFTVSTGDNAGLALLVADLAQDLDPNTGNPASLDIPPAGGVPGSMSNFSRPAGISNPGESDPTTGYPGVQRGASGAANLIQIGGGQNTFGAARSPGTGVAENANVVGGVGQSGSVVLASGSFTAPSANGAYTFSLENVVANVLLAVNTPPSFSPTTAANVVVSSGSFGFIVGGAAPCPGDTDGDNDVDLEDLLAVLGNFGCTGGGCAGDADGDGDTGLPDLLLVLSNFGQTCP